MKHNCPILDVRCLCLLVLLLARVPVQSAEIYFGPSLAPNSFQIPRVGGMALMSGGNVDSIETAPSAVLGAQDIRLVQSAIGFPSLTSVGQPQDVIARLLEARDKLRLAARYRYNRDILTGNPSTEKSDGTFNIVDSGPDRNYFEEEILQIADAYRVVVRMAPLSPEPYRGLVQTYWERIMAAATLANQDYVDSVNQRLLPVLGDPEPGAPDSPLAKQRGKLISAQQRLDGALGMFAELARDQVEGRYLQPEAPMGVWSIDDSLESQASELFASYVRALALAIEIEEQIQRLDYFMAYGNPLSGSGPPATGPGSAAAVKVRAEFYQDFSVLAGAFTHLESFAFSPIGKVASGLSSLQSLADDIRLARVSFSPGAQQGAGNQDYVQTSFGPNYVPFLTAAVPGATASRTFDNLVALTFGGGAFGGALNDALADETAARNASEEVINNEQLLQDRTAETLIRYNGQLIELCGSMPSPIDDTPMPDLEGFLFPPDLRKGFTGRDGTGAILGQYLRIESTETRYEAAVQDFRDLFREIDITEQAAAEQAGLARQTGEALAHIYTANGMEFSLLEKASADIAAESEREIARRQAKDHERSQFDKIADVVKVGAVVGAGGFLVVATGGSAAVVAAGLAQVGVAGGIGLYDNINGWSDLTGRAKTIVAVGDLRAQTIERRNEIQIQQILLRAAESADVALVSADGQALQIEARAREQILKLYVKFERLKLNILLAEQDIEIAKLELANLFDKVAYLIHEYVEAVLQIVDLPLNRPDFRYIRDYRIAVAENAFRRAQMWVYLTAKSAQYRFMTTGSYSQASDLVAMTLKCRNATELKDKVATPLKDLGPLFYLGNGFAAEGQVKNVVLSLRDQVFQNNLLRRLPDGEVDTNAPSFFLPVAGGGALNPERASDEQWLSILDRSIIGADEGKPLLRLAFSTSFDPRGNNPLFTDLADQFGHVILSASLTRKGVFINLKGRALPLRSYQIKLEQIGTTYLPYSARNNAGAWAGTQLPVRIWGLPARSASITAVLNKDNFTAFTDPNIVPSAGFDERSPYCDQWLLTIDGSTAGSPNWQLLTEELAGITDIQIGLTVQGFDPQQAR